MSSEYRAARNCNINDLPDWSDSIRTALTNAGLTLNENNFGDILRVLDGEFGFDFDSKEIREDILDKLSRIVKEHLGETEYRRILNSDCNFLVSDPTDLNARSNLPGARVHDEKETITGNKVEDFIIYMIYPFLNPYDLNAAAGEASVSETLAPAANTLNQLSFGPPGSFDSDDEDMNRSGGKRRRKKSRRKSKSKKSSKSKKRSKSKKHSKSKKSSKSKKRIKSKKKRKSRKNRKQ